MRHHTLRASRALANPGTRLDRIKGMQDSRLIAVDGHPGWEAMELQAGETERWAGMVEVDIDEVAPVIAQAARAGHPVAVDWVVRLGMAETMGLFSQPD